MVTGMLRDHLKQDLLTLESWTDLEDCAVQNSFMEMSYAKSHQQRCKLTKGDLRKCLRQLLAGQNY